MSSHIIDDSAEHDAHWMRVALREAEAAALLGEVPIGAVLVARSTNTRLAVGHNLRETLHDPTAHAEVVALRSAARERHMWRLDGTTLYVTLEPCAMCAGALVAARVDRVVFGALDAKAGGLVSHFGIGTTEQVRGHRLRVSHGVLEEECRGVLQQFFQALRAMGEK